MKFQNIQLKKGDFEASNWQEVFNLCDRKECRCYDTAFAVKAQEAEKSGDSTLQELFTLLHVISSFYMNLSSKDELFGPKIRWFQNNTRSAIPDDVPEMHWEVLSEIVSEVKDAEMRARIADLIWIKTRDYKKGELAVNSYIESAEELDDLDHWPSCAERIERALQLAVQLGRRTKCYGNVISTIESFINKYSDECKSFFPARLLKLLIEKKHGDPAKYLLITDSLARNAETNKDWPKAREYWELKAVWCHLNKDEVGSKTAKISAAETYVRESENTAKRSHLAASQNLREAIEAYRRIGGQDQNIEKLHKKLLTYEKRSLKEMQRFSADFDNTKLAEDAQNYISNRKFPDVLFVLSLMGAPSKKSDMKEQVIELAQKAPLRFLVAQQALSREGKMVARRPSMFENGEEAMKSEMFRILTFNQSFHVDTTIEPARLQIIMEHNISVRDFVQVIENSPFVFPGREWIFARGLNAGLNGDFLISTHLLIPQIEDSIRYILSLHGVIASGLTSEFIQEEYNLNKTLRMDEFGEIFGEDLQFDLQGLLIEKFGSNLRNRVAHGLMDMGQFYSEPCVYLWWSVLRLCLLPIINANPSILRQEL